MSSDYLGDLEEVLDILRQRSKSINNVVPGSDDETPLPRTTSEGPNRNLFATNKRQDEAPGGNSISEDSGQKEGSSDAPVDTTAASTGGGPSSFYKTKPCKFYQQGHCWKGVHCQFAHSDEMRSVPNLTKTRICPDFKKGTCLLSARECTFAHGFDDLRGKDEFYKTGICSFWKAGYCKAGAMCRHAHGEHELRPRTDQPDDPPYTPPPPLYNSDPPFSHHVYRLADGSVHHVYRLADGTYASYPMGAPHMEWSTTPIYKAPRDPKIVESGKTKNDSKELEPKKSEECKKSEESNKTEESKKSDEFKKSDVQGRTLHKELFYGVEDSDSEVDLQPSVSAPPFRNYDPS